MEVLLPRKHPFLFKISRSNVSVKLVDHAFCRWVASQKLLGPGASSVKASHDSSCLLDMDYLYPARVAIQSSAQRRCREEQRFVRQLWNDRPVAVVVELPWSLPCWDANSLLHQMHGMMSTVLR